jgi:protease-4
MDQLLNETKGGNYLDEELQATLGEYYQPIMLMKQIRQMTPIQTRLPYYIYIR